jgi:hypothetical protein
MVQVYGFGRMRVMMFLLRLPATLLMLTGMVCLGTLIALTYAVAAFVRVTHRWSTGRELPERRRPFGF